MGEGHDQAFKMNVSAELNVSAYDPTNLMLDASVSLNTPTPAASDVGFHRSRLKHGELSYTIMSRG